MPLTTANFLKFSRKLRTESQKNLEVLQSDERILEMKPLEICISTWASCLGATYSVSSYIMAYILFLFISLQLLLLTPVGGKSVRL